MKKKANRNYKYIKIRNLYINTNLSAFTIGKKLYKDANPFAFDTSIPIPILNKLPENTTRFIRVFRISIIFFFRKHLLKDNEVLYSDRFGHVLLKRQLNNLSINKFVYKVFNLNQYTITSEYGEDATTEEMKLDLDKVELISSLKIAPELLKINLNKKYYIESYLNLRHPKPNQWEKCIPLINNLITKLYDSFKLKNSDKNFFISSKKPEIPKDFCKSDFENEVRYIKDFIERVQQGILSNTQSKIYFSQSHGDLNSTNFFLDNNKIYGIDWELLEYRTLFYDVFYVMLLVNRKDFNSIKQNEIGNLTKSSITNLEKYVNQYIKLNKSNVRFYLNCFYYTYLDWKLRIYLTYNNYDDAKRRLNEILLDIEGFKDNEVLIIDAF